MLTEAQAQRDETLDQNDLNPRVKTAHNILNCPNVFISEIY